MNISFDRYLDSARKSEYELRWLEALWRKETVCEPSSTVPTHVSRLSLAAQQWLLLFVQAIIGGVPTDSTADGEGSQ